MKTKIKNSTEKFKPFKIEFTVETIQDARLLYHLSNHADVVSLILSDTSYGDGYNQDCTKSLPSNLASDIGRQTDGIVV